MPTSPFIAAINQIVDEKGLPRDVVIETIEAALAAAYRKEYGKPHQIVRTKLNAETGDFDVTQVYEVVEEVKNDQHELTPEQAKEYKKDAKLSDEIIIPLPHRSEFGRIAAQTAKQVILQRIREAERDIIFQEFKEKENQLLTGTIQNIEGSTVIVNLQKTNALMPASEQIPKENYYIGQRLRVLVKVVEESARGPRIIVSRADPGFIKGLFTLEVPEILAGTVVIQAIAREAGSRSKVAVQAKQENLDPIGSCVGQRGTRISAILSELSGEKIDIILWDDKLEQLITNALSPAKIEKVKINKKKQTASVTVAPEMLSLAIGKGGQNVRLAGKLAGFTIDIVKTKSATGKKEAAETQATAVTKSDQSDNQTTKTTDGQSSQGKSPGAASAEAESQPPIESATPPKATKEKPTKPKN